LLFFAEAYRAIYYYHGDHLGSSNYITDRTGRVFEHTIYLPYGETWIDEGHETSLLGYKFTGKELDEETGLYYFGARYYDAKFSSWISTDPAIDKFIPDSEDLFFPSDPFNQEKLPGSGGVYNSVNMSLYHYAGLNPMKIIDPDGRENQKAAKFLQPKENKDAIKIVIIMGYDSDMAGGKSGQVKKYEAAQELDKRNDVDVIYVPNSDEMMSTINQYKNAETIVFTGHGTHSKNKEPAFLFDAKSALRAEGTKQKFTGKVKNIFFAGCNTGKNRSYFNLFSNDSNKNDLNIYGNEGKTSTKQGRKYLENGKFDLKSFLKFYPDAVELPKN